MNSQNEDDNDKDYASVKDKGKKRPSEASEKTKKGGKVPNNLNQCINFKDSLQDHNIDSILILAG